jgi:hypothetical protein
MTTGRQPDPASPRLPVGIVAGIFVILAAAVSMSGSSPSSATSTPVSSLQKHRPVAASVAAPTIFAADCTTTRSRGATPPCMRV